MNEIARYNNQLNTVPMRRWTPEEQNFFFAIITQARDKGTALLKFEKADLVEFANYTLEHNKRFYETIESLGDKLSTMRYKERTSNSFKIMALFQRFEVHWSDDLSEMTAEVRVSEDFEYIVNRLEADFTQFELKQFTNIRSSYAKEMFKKLKQWRTVGKKEYPVKEFREMLEIPKSYGTKEINTRVLAPIRAELPDYFVGLKVKPIKAKKRGTPVIAYEFTWQPEKAGTWVDGKYEKKKRRDVTAKKPTRRESLPEWAKDDYVAPREKRLSREEQQQFRKRLEKIRKNNSKEVD